MGRWERRARRPAFTSASRSPLMPAHAAKETPMSTKNTLKTGLLLAALTGVLAVAGHLVGGTAGLIIALLFAVVMNGATYWFSDRLALAMAHARSVARSDAPLLYAQVEDLAARAGVPMPAVYLIDDPSPNAFATGRNPRHAAVAVTTGLLHLLDQRELRGVLAHEFAHIKNRDILLTTVAATIAGAISALANIFQFATLFGSHDEDEEGGSMLGGLAMLILAPIAATMIQLAISRAREYAAHATGARLCGEPRALASALSKLERGTWLRPMQINPAAAPLFIVHPFAGGGLLRLFSTHPPIAERIARLEAMASRSASQGWGRADVSASCCNRPLARSGARPGRTCDVTWPTCRISPLPPPRRPPNTQDDDTPQPAHAWDAAGIASTRALSSNSSAAPARSGATTVVAPRRRSISSSSGCVLRTKIGTVARARRASRTTVRVGPASGRATTTSRACAMRAAASTGA